VNEITINELKMYSPLQVFLGSLFFGRGIAWIEPGWRCNHVISKGHGIGDAFRFCFPRPWKGVYSKRHEIYNTI